ncbi:hypothetical protein V2H07_01170 [Streptococcus agalactiae]|uniref:hypothetical protein n=1 Tax=Streptococcus agalactiae TaxID=1311 RepID=UPI002EC7C109|nr:hypothetical protein [Streptococcus agalactiae]MEE3765780.1 hypothetical protein [Streptococcus agalactiae]
MKDRLPRIFIVINVFLIFINLTLVAYDSYNYVKSYETKIIKLNQEIKSKDQQIKGLTNQLDRTQYQLKKVSEESADKTKRIAELTGNGG